MQIERCDRESEAVHEPWQEQALADRYDIQPLSLASGIEEVVLFASGVEATETTVQLRPREERCTRTLLHITSME
jgi:hypothetical protein